MKIHIITAGNFNHKERLVECTKLLDAYCKRHAEVTYTSTYWENWKGQFDKLAELLKYINDYDYVIWLDSDCCIVDLDFEIEPALKKWSTPATRLWIAQDWNGLCGCFIVMKSCQWSIDLLRTIVFMGNVRYNFGEFEQGALKAIFASYPKHSWRFSLLPSSIVADQTMTPLPIPFIWHLSMHEKTVAFMRRVTKAVLAGKFDVEGPKWQGLPHG